MQHRRQISLLGFQLQGLTWSFVYPCDWVTPTWLAINPAVDNEADAQAVRDGRMSYQEFCAKWGVDWRKQIATAKRSIRFSISTASCSTSTRASAPAQAA